MNEQLIEELQTMSNRLFLMSERAERSVAERLISAHGLIDEVINELTDQEEGEAENLEE